MVQEASMAKLVRRHTSNVEIIGSNPIGSILELFCSSYLVRKPAVIIGLDKHVPENIDGAEVKESFLTPSKSI